VQKEIIERIKNQLDIVDVIGRYIGLTKKGVSYSALCPFHTEKTPSFTVNPSMQIFKCFGCGAGGDMFEFVRMYESVGFVEAVEILAETAGIAIKQDNGVEYEYLMLNNEIMEYWLDGDAVKSFISERHIDHGLIDTYKIGYCDKNRLLLPKFENKAQMMNELGLVYKDRDGYHDRFVDRMIFPIIQHRYPIGFGGRTMIGNAAKYINSKDSDIYHKSEALFGLGQAKTDIRKNKVVYIVEGYTDAMAYVTAGIKAVVATCGTACTKNHIRLLLRYADTLILSYDNDRAGVSAEYRTCLLALKYGVIASVVRIPHGKDPNKTLIDDGPAVLLKAAENAIPFHIYYKNLFSRCTVKERLRFFSETTNAVKYIQDDAVRTVITDEIYNTLGIEKPHKTTITKKGNPAGRMITIEQQAIPYLFDKRYRSKMLKIVGPEDFVENHDLFLEIINNDQPNVNDLSVKYPKYEQYLYASTQISLAKNMDKLYAIAMHLRKRTLLREMYALELQMASSTGDVAESLSQKWQLKHDLLVVLSKLNTEKNVTHIVDGWKEQ